MTAAGQSPLDCVAVEEPDQNLIHFVKPTATGGFRKSNDCNSPARGKTEREGRGGSPQCLVNTMNALQFLGSSSILQDGSLFFLHTTGAAAENKKAQAL